MMLKAPMRFSTDSLEGGVAADTPGTRGSRAVTAFVDTNVLVRHLTGDPPAQAKRATRFLERADELLLADRVAALSCPHHDAMMRA
jgi:hypothetical protein